MQMFVVNIHHRRSRGRKAEQFQYVTTAPDPQNAIERVRDWVPSLFFDERFESAAACAPLAPAIRVGVHFD